MFDVTFRCISESLIMLTQIAKYCGPLAVHCGYSEGTIGGPLGFFAFRFSGVQWGLTDKQPTVLPLVFFFF